MARRSPGRRSPPPRSRSLLAHGGARLMSAAITLPVMLHRARTGEHAGLVRGAHRTQLLQQRGWDVGERELVRCHVPAGGGHRVDHVLGAVRCSPPCPRSGCHRWHRRSPGTLLDARGRPRVGRTRESSRRCCCFGCRTRSAPVSPPPYPPSPLRRQACRPWTAMALRRVPLDICMDPLFPCVGGPHRNKTDTVVMSPDQVSAAHPRLHVSTFVVTWRRRRSERCGDARCSR